MELCFFNFTSVFLHFVFLYFASVFLQFTSVFLQFVLMFCVGALALVMLLLGADLAGRLGLDWA